jgi:hypothetical protein
MMKETDFTALKNKLDRVKSELSTKRGEQQALRKRLQKEFGMKEGDDPYKLLRDLSAQIEAKEEKRSILLKKVGDILEGYSI